MELPEAGSFALYTNKPTPSNFSTGPPRKPRLNTNSKRNSCRPPAMSTPNSYPNNFFNASNSAQGPHSPVKFVGKIITKLLIVIIGWIAPIKDVIHLHNLLLWLSKQVQNLRIGSGLQKVVPTLTSHLMHIISQSCSRLKVMTLLE